MDSVIVMLWPRQHEIISCESPGVDFAAETHLDLWLSGLVLLYVYGGGCSDSTGLYKYDNKHKDPQIANQ